MNLYKHMLQTDMWTGGDWKKELIGHDLRGVQEIFFGKAETRETRSQSNSVANSRVNRPNQSLYRQLSTIITDDIYRSSTIASDMVPRRMDLAE